MIKFLDAKNQENLISDVVTHPLTVNRDRRGVLVEVLKSTWTDVYDPKKLPRAQSYYSLTHPGFARDEHAWHYHPNQWDRFAVAQGDAILALYDWREGSSTKGVLNLFLMGERNGDARYLLLIPANVLHSFTAIGERDCLLLGIPTHLYDPKEEGRIAFSKVPVSLPDGTAFSWEKVRKNITK